MTPQDKPLLSKLNPNLLSPRQQAELQSQLPNSQQQNQSLNPLDHNLWLSHPHTKRILQKLSQLNLNCLAQASQLAEVEPVTDLKLRLVLCKANVIGKLITKINDGNLDEVI